MENRIQTILLIQMELTKQNIISMQVQLSQHVLANNFKFIDQQLKKLKSEMKTLSNGQATIINKINDMDPYDGIDFNMFQEPQQHSSTGLIACTPQQPVSALIEVPDQPSNTGVQANPVPCKPVERSSIISLRGEECSARADESARQSKVEIMQPLQRKGSESFIRELIRDLEGRLAGLEGDRDNHKIKLEELKNENNIFKKMLGWKEPKEKKKKDPKERRSSKNLSDNEKVKGKDEDDNDAVVEEEEECDLLMSLKKQLADTKKQLLQKLQKADQKIERSLTGLITTNLQLQTVNEDSNLTKTSLQALENQLSSTNQSLMEVSNRLQQQKNTLSTQLGTQRTTFGTRLTTANGQGYGHGRSTFSGGENSRNFYEEKIVQIFQDMDQLRNQYLEVLEKDMPETNSGSDSENRKKLVEKIGVLPRQSQDQVKKQIALLKKQLKRLKDQFNDLAIGVNTGQTRTLVIKPNQNKEDWKQISQKIYKLRQEIVSYVKQLQSKINTNTDITVLIQEMQLAISQCRIINGKKVNTIDFQKFGKRVQNKLNNFIKIFCQKFGIENQEFGLAKQQLHCSTADAENKNSVGKVAKNTCTEKFGGRKVNPELHMIRRAQSKLPSLH